MLSCFSQSTAHGLSHIGNEPSFYGKFVWFFLTIATSALFAFHTYSLYSQMLDEQVFISTYPNKVPFIQPDIVFCSERIFARDFISNPPEHEYAYMLNTSKAIQEFDKLYKKFPFKSSKIIWDSLDFHQLYTAFYHRKNELFLNITCNLHQVDFNKLKVEMSLTHFACFRLTSDLCHLSSPFDTLIIKFYIHIYGKNANETGLDVNINNRPLDSYLFVQKESTDEVSDGVHVYFVQPNEAIQERSSRIMAGANMQTDIKIKSTQYERISNLKTRCQKVVKYDQFYNLLEANIAKNLLNYTENSLCVYKEFQKVFFKVFKCVSKLLPIPVTIKQNFTYCGDLHRQKSFISSLYANITTRKLFYSDNLINKCKFTVPCITVKHDATVNYNSWPWKATLERLLSVEIPDKLNKDGDSYSSPGLSAAVEDYSTDPSNVLSWRKNFIKVSITSDEFKSTQVVESPSYSFKNFFSDVGGIMGFYMGASLLTVFELFRVIYFTLYSLMPSRKKQCDNDTEMQTSKDQES